MSEDTCGGLTAILTDIVNANAPLGVACDVLFSRRLLGLDNGAKIHEVSA